MRAHQVEETIELRLREGRGMVLVRTHDTTVVVDVHPARAFQVVLGTEPPLRQSEPRELT
jgi:hypothetical protein